MILYKLTNQDFTTRKGESNETLWGENVTHEAKGAGTELCSDGFIHAYEHPLIAVLLNPIHAKLKNPILWECEGEISIKESQLKCGTKKLTTVKQIPIPGISLQQKIRFAIGCSLKVYKEKSYITWALNWLNGSDKSAAYAAAANTAATVTAAAYAYAASCAADTSYAAACAAASASYAAAGGADDAYAAADTSYAAADTSYAAACAADAAYAASIYGDSIDIIKIAEWSVSDKPYETS